MGYLWVVGVCLVTTASAGSTIGIILMKKSFGDTGRLVKLNFDQYTNRDCIAYHSLLKGALLRSLPSVGCAGNDYMTHGTPRWWRLRHASSFMNLLLPLRGCCCP